MKIVGIVKLDWANAAWKTFQALKKHGMDAHLINLQSRTGPFGKYVSQYDIKYWTKKGKKHAERVIKEADVYHVFESGKTLENLRGLKLKDRPRIISLNSSMWYNRGAQQKFDNTIKPKCDLATTLTANMPLEGTVLTLQPLSEDDFPIRQDYSLRGKRLLVGAAPGYRGAYNRKGFGILENKIKSLDLIMHASPQDVKRRMQNKHDIFTHGMGKGGYGYSMTEAAMLGIPCFAYLREGNVDNLLVNGILPILQLGPNAEYLEDILELLSKENNRRKYGQLAAKWARKYHGYEACYKIYYSLYGSLLGKTEKVKPELKPKGYDEINYWRTRPNPNNPRGVAMTPTHAALLKKNILTDGKILDFGAGNGRLFPAFEHVAEVEAFDIVDTYQKELFQNAAKYNFKFNFVSISKVGELPYKNKEFNTAVASQVLLHQRPENIEKVMKELMRVARKVLVITWLEEETPQDTSEHCFHHDYFRICERNNWTISNFERISNKSVFFILENG